MSDPFMEAAKGRVPIQTGYGSAAAMLASGNIPVDSPGPHVPRPDCKIDTLFWLSFLTGAFGLDHFYLRSPITGLVKMLFGVGLIILAFLGPGSKLVNVMSGLPLLFWWLWDWIQIWTEKERVLNYGLCTPGEIIQGIGQGSITDKSSEYKSNSSIWIMMSQLFGFLGFTHLASNHTIPGLRIVWIQLISIICIIAIALKWKGWEAAVTFGVMHWIAGLLIVWIWFKSITSGPTISEDDQDTRDKVEGMINYFKEYLSEELVSVLSIKHISTKDIQKLNEISHSSEFRQAQKGNSNKITIPTLPFMALPDMIGVGIMMIYYAIFPAAGAAAEAYKALAKTQQQAASIAAQQAADVAGTLAIPSTTAAGLAAQAGVAGKLAIPRATAAGLAAQAGVAGKLAIPRATAAGLAAQQAASVADLAAQRAVVGTLAIPRATAASVAQTLAKQAGGSRDLSTESQLLGVTVAAILGGGAIKGLVDFLMVNQ